MIARILKRCWGISLLSLIAATNFAGATHSSDTWTVGDIRIEQAWAWFESPNAQFGAVYLTVHNTSNELDYLVAATSPTAGSSAIYELKSEQGRKRLVPIPGGLNLTGHREIVMRPDGIQLILSEVSAPPKAGQTLELQLIFLNAGKLNLAAPVHPSNAEIPAIIHKGHRP